MISFWCSCISTSHVPFMLGAKWAPPSTGHPPLVSRCAVVSSTEGSRSCSFSLLSPLGPCVHRREAHGASSEVPRFLQDVASMATVQSGSCPCPQVVPIPLAVATGGLESPCCQWAGTPRRPCALHPLAPSLPTCLCQGSLFSLELPCRRGLGMHALLSLSHRHHGCGVGLPSPAMGYSDRHE